MKLFGDLPQERAMRTLIHDTNSSTGRINSYVELINRAPENIEDYLAKIKIAVKDTQNRIDEYYKKFEADFPET